jgi:hypothetical protein
MKKRTNSYVSGFSNGVRCFRISVSTHSGRVAQLGEHLLCKQGVGGSNPLTSTKSLLVFRKRNSLTRILS